MNSCLLQMLITLDQGGDGLARFSADAWDKYRYLSAAKPETSGREMLVLDLDLHFSALPRLFRSVMARRDPSAIVNNFVTFSSNYNPYIFISSCPGDV